MGLNFLSQDSSRLFWVVVWPSPQTTSSCLFFTEILSSSLLLGCHFYFGHALLLSLWSYSFRDYATTYHLARQSLLFIYLYHRFLHCWEPKAFYIILLSSIFPLGRNITDKIFVKLAPPPILLVQPYISSHICCRVSLFNLHNRMVQIAADQEVKWINEDTHCWNFNWLKFPAIITLPAKVRDFSTSLFLALWNLADHWSVKYTFLGMRCLFLTWSHKDSSAFQVWPSLIGWHQASDGILVTCSPLASRGFIHLSFCRAAL